MFTLPCYYLFFFFFNDTATTEIYTLSLHDALPICVAHAPIDFGLKTPDCGLKTMPIYEYELCEGDCKVCGGKFSLRSEEHTSELQSRLHLVCRLLLEKKKNIPLDYYSMNGRH